MTHFARTNLKELGTWWESGKEEWDVCEIMKLWDGLDWKGLLKVIWSVSRSIPKEISLLPTPSEPARNISRNVASAPLWKISFKDEAGKGKGKGIPHVQWDHFTLCIPSPPSPSLRDLGIQCRVWSFLCFPDKPGRDSPLPGPILLPLGNPLMEPN